MKKVLITGITGYIGSHLARALLPDCDVYGLVREPLHASYIEDIRDRLRLVTVDGTYESIHSAVQFAQPDAVYHLAAYYTGTHNGQETPKLVESNIVFGAYLLEAMAAHNVPALVYASSVMTRYEGTAYRPLNLYAATKQAFSDLLAYYTDTAALRAVTLMLSDTYGPGDRRPKILNLVKRAAQTGEKLALSDGSQTYDVVHIDDVVRAFQQAGEMLSQRQTWKNETFQVGAPRPLTLRQTVEQMLAVNHFTLCAAWGRRPQPAREIRQAVRLYPPLPGWKPEVPLEQGLRCFADG